MRAGNPRSTPQQQPTRTEVSNDKRNWRFQAGELVEQNRNRSLWKQSVVESLLSFGKEDHSSQKGREEREKAKEK